MQKSFDIRKISLIGVMSALVFASNYISFPIGDISRVHMGNVVCLLSGFILGGVGGGFAAGIGSALYDLTNPLYTPDMAFTFAFKFIMAYICGKIAYGNGKNALAIPRNAIAAILGNLAYLVLHVSKNFINDVFFLQMETITALLRAGQKTSISSINLVIACAISVPLALILKKSLKNYVQ